MRATARNESWNRNQERIICGKAEMKKENQLAKYSGTQYWGHAFPRSGEGRAPIVLLRGIVEGDGKKVCL